MYSYLFLLLNPAPSSPSGVNVSQNGVNSILVSWTPPLEEPTVTGYIIYYQRDGGERLSQSTGAAATTATITGVIAGTYSITVVATSNTLPSIESIPQLITLGSIYQQWVSNYIVHYAS